MYSSALDIAVKKLAALSYKINKHRPNNNEDNMHSLYIKLGPK